jgi:hypothetical protein
MALRPLDRAKDCGRNYQELIGWQSIRQFLLIACSIERGESPFLNFFFLPPPKKTNSREEAKMGEYLCFSDISKQITFPVLLNHLNIAFTEEKEGEIKAEYEGKIFIISKEKNLFFNARNKEEKGSVINFLADHLKISLRESASMLKKTFLDKMPAPEREIPELELHYTKQVEEMGIDEDTAKNLEIGQVKQKSIMAGKVAFKVYNNQGDKVGYVGKDKDGWFYPKNFPARGLLYNLNRANGDKCFLCSSPLEAVKLISNGVLCSIGLFSKSLSEEQEKLIVDHFKFVFLCLSEPDPIALRLSRNLFIRILSPTATAEQIKGAMV